MAFPTVKPVFSPGRSQIMQRQVSWVETSSRPVTEPGSPACASQDRQGYRPKRTVSTVKCSSPTKTPISRRPRAEECSASDTSAPSRRRARYLGPRCTCRPQTSPRLPRIVGSATGPLQSTHAHTGLRGITPVVVGNSTSQRGSLAAWLWGQRPRAVREPRPSASHLVQSSSART